MNRARTIYEILELLAAYHEQRRSDFEHQGRSLDDPVKTAFWSHLAELEEHASNAIRVELDQLDPAQSAYLMTGPPLPKGRDNAHHCGDEPTFDDTVACVLASDEFRSEALDRLENAGAAPSVVKLAKRLRELEETQARQIANFTRAD